MAGIEFFWALVSAAVFLFLIMDPFASIPIFITLTKGHKPAELRSAATKAVMIAAVVAVIFLFVGPTVLDVMHITLKDFKIAGGILLMLLGIESVFGVFPGMSKSARTMETVVVLVGTPLLTGPGLMATLIVLAEESGMVITLLALAITLFVSWALLYYSQNLGKLLGHNIIYISSRVIGLFLLALGVAYIRSGLV